MALRVHRKGFTRVREGQRERVAPSTFTIKDVGARGRGPKVIPPLKKGALGGPGFFSKSTEERHRIEANKASLEGEKKIQGRLQAVAIFNKRTNPTLARKAAADRRFIAGSFRGRKRVRFPSGFDSRL